jgi:beta-lactamase regulating signal transducer with metallopeptidase domain
MKEMLRILVNGMSHQSVQIAAVFLIVFGATWLLRRRSAHWRYMLWLVVLVKCLTPPVVSVPLAILPLEKTPASVIIVPATTEGNTPTISSIAHKWTAIEPSVENKGTQHPGTAYTLEPIASTEPVAPVAAVKTAETLPAVPPSTIVTTNPA